MGVRRSSGCEEQWVTLMKWSGAEGTGHSPSSYHVTADFTQARRRRNVEPSAPSLGPRNHETRGYKLCFPGSSMCGVVTLSTAWTPGGEI